MSVADSVQFFVTCMADLFRPEAARAAVRVLERHGWPVAFPTAQTCCGQFGFNAGYHREAAQLARHFLTVFEGAPGPIVGISGSCVAMVREYPSLLYQEALFQGDSEAQANEWKDRAQALAERTWEWSQWLVRQPSKDAGVVRDAGEAGKAGEGPTRTNMVHHLGCHMRRLLAATAEPAELAGGVGVDLIEPEAADQCCGFGGTYSMTEPAVSTAMADAKWQAIHEAAEQHHAVALTGLDLGCLLHLQGRLSRCGDNFPVRHLAEVVDLAETGPPGHEALDLEGRGSDGGTASA